VNQWWEDMLAKAEADLRAADADVEITQAELEKATAANAAAIERQANMRATREWVRQLRPSGEPVAPGAPATRPAPARTPAAAGTTRKLFGKDMPVTPLTQLSMETLEKLNRSASTKQVRESLARDGHEYSQSQVRGALKYLAGKKNPPIESTKPGVWRLRRVNPPAPFTPEPTVSGVAMNGSR
jgi:hypothetical protein